MPTVQEDVQEHRGIGDPYEDPQVRGRIPVSFTIPQTRTQSKNGHHNETHEKSAHADKDRPSKEDTADTADRNQHSSTSPSSTPASTPEKPSTERP